MRSEVSGVRNSCATVATRSFLSSSKRMQPGHVLEHDRSTPMIAPPSVDTGVARGSRNASWSPSVRAHRLVEAPADVRARGRPARARAPARSAPRTSGGAGASGSVGLVRRVHAQARLGRPIDGDELAVGSNTTTGSGRLSIAACAACWAGSSSPSELARYCSSWSAIVLNSVASSAISSRPCDARARLEVALARGGAPPSAARRAAAACASVSATDASNAQHAGGDRQRRSSPRPGAAPCWRACSLLRTIASWLIARIVVGALP